LGNLVRFVLLPGNRYDTVGVEPLIQDIEFEGLTADTAFDADWIIDELNERGAKSVISQRSRRGAKKAIGAATSILTAAYHILKDGTFYKDLGPDHFETRAKAVQTKRPVSRLKNLGYSVRIEPISEAA
ncbi:MAG: hypothetical protein JO110_29155, partial [Acetobacteraceae bacterium]|nr:hypothetical protein [Acetobacteraceae bacterium]